LQSACIAVFQFSGTDLPKAPKTAAGNRSLSEPASRLPPEGREAHPPQKRLSLLLLSSVLMAIWMAFLAWMAFWT